MRCNECPICHRYFPVGLWDHIEKCRDRELEKAPNGYKDFYEYIRSSEEANADA